MTHVRTSPFYPPSNGKYERFNRSLKAECLRPQTPLSLQAARRIVGRFVAPYNEVRLHSAIGYVAPKDRLEGRAESIFQGRREKLEAARRRKRDRKQPTRTHDHLTLAQRSCRTQVAGETEGSSAGKQLPRDGQPGARRGVAEGAAQRGCSRANHLSSTPQMSEENPGSAQASHPLTAEFHLSISR